MLKYKVSLFVLILLLSLSQIVFSVYMYPLIESDGIAFLPAAINFSHGRGLINDVYEITRLLNDNNLPAYYINYPPVFPILFGWLFRLTLNLHLNYAIVHIILMILFTFIIQKKYNVFSDKIKIIFLFLFLISWNTQLNPGVGRPEPIAQLFFLLFLIALHFSYSFFSALFSAFLVVLIGFTHPVLGIYSLLILAIFYSYNYFNYQKLLFSFLGFTIGLLLVIYLYPYEFTSLIAGIIRHGQLVVLRNTFSFAKFSYYHLLNPDYSFYFLIFLISIILYFKLIIIYHTIVNSKKIFIVLNILLLVSIFYFTFQTIEASYNLYVLFPLFGLVIFNGIQTFKSQTRYILISFIFILSSIGYFRRVCLFPYFLLQGKSYLSAKSEVSFLSNNSYKIYVSTSMFILFNEMENLTDEINYPGIKYLLKQQNFTMQKKPKEIFGYKIIKSNFVSSDVKIFGFKIASSCPGYQYVLYEKIN